MKSIYPATIKTSAAVIILFLIPSLLFSDGTNVSPATTNNPGLVLFAVDSRVVSKEGTVTVFGTPEVLPEPIIKTDHPPSQRECAWGSVIREKDGLFRMWYCTMNMGSKVDGGHAIANAGVWGRGDDFGFHPRDEYDVPITQSMIGRYAESKDGIHWTQPDFGIYSFRGSKNNNIILTGENISEQTDGALTNFDGWTVVRDDNEPDPQKRYKTVAHWESIHFWDNSVHNGYLNRPADKMKKFASARGKYITYSPDGIHWDLPWERIAYPDNGGDRFLFVRDHRNDRWMAYSRAGDVHYAAISTSENLIDWTIPSAEKELSSDNGIINAVESIIPFNYGAQDMGFAISMNKKKGIMLSYLIYHRDGEPWKWLNTDTPAIPSGPESSYYATGAVPLHNEPFIVGDKLYIYFNAFSYNQKVPCPYGSRTIGLAMLKLDRFAGLATKESSASITTKPIKVTGKNLYINFEPEDTGGYVQAALLNAKGEEIPGYGMKDCIPVEKDGVREKIHWKKHKNTEKLMDKDVSVKIMMNGKCAVYSMIFGE